MGVEERAARGAWSTILDRIMEPGTLTFRPYLATQNAEFHKGRKIRGLVFVNPRIGNLAPGVAYAVLK